MGLFELGRAGGTIALQGLGDASEAFFSCLRQVLLQHSYFAVGGVTTIPFSARLLALVTPESGRGFPGPVDPALCFSLNLPLLKDRQEDVSTLFRFFLLRESILMPPRTQKELEEILSFYSWPANLISLSAVSKRYILLYQQAMNPSPSAKQQILIRAIGEDELLSDIYRQYPALTDAANSRPEEVLAGVAAMKRILKYNNSVIADKLGLGRTTLWRIQKKAGVSDAGEDTDSPEPIE